MSDRGFLSFDPYFLLVVNILLGFRYMTMGQTDRQQESDAVDIPAMDPRKVYYQTTKIYRTNCMQLSVQGTTYVIDCRKLSAVK